MIMEQQFEIVAGEVQFTTENTVWTLSPDAYMRTPRRENHPITTLSDNPFANDEWVPYKKVWFCVDESGRSSLRILPATRDDSMQGIMTGFLLDD